MYRDYYFTLSVVRINSSVYCLHMGCEACTRSLHVKKGMWFVNTGYVEALQQFSTLCLTWSNSGTVGEVKI